MNPTEHISNEPEFSDGCDHDGFPGGCERAGHSKENCPYVKHKSDTPKCLHCDKTLDVKAPPAETVCENCGAHGVIKKSETPETDAKMKFCFGDDVEFVKADFARELERERDQLRARVGELVAALQRCLNVAYENPDDWRVQIGQAVDKAMKGQE